MWEHDHIPTTPRGTKGPWCSITELQTSTLSLLMLFALCPPLPPHSQPLFLKIVSHYLALVEAWLAWDTSCVKLDWPGIQTSICLCLPSAGIEGVHHHSWSFYNSSDGKFLGGCEEGMRDGSEWVLLLQRTPVWFPAPRGSDSSGLCGHLHEIVHTHNTHILS